MRPNPRLFLHALRMLVLAIALVISPARSLGWETSAAETPVLVVAVAKPEPATAALPVEARRLSERVSRATLSELPRQRATDCIEPADPNRPQIVERYLLNSAWLC
jgi:hypothetical protein